jgi:hypothetical protein
MSLSDQLNSMQPKRSNQGCVTCKWLDTLKEPDRRAFDNWITDGKSIAQLWQACYDDTDNPLNISNTPFRDHIRHHEPLA